MFCQMYFVCINFSISCIQPRKRHTCYQFLKSDRIAGTDIHVTKSIIESISVTCTSKNVEEAKIAIQNKNLGFIKGT